MKKKNSQVNVGGNASVQKKSAKGKRNTSTAQPNSVKPKKDSKVLEPEKEEPSQKTAAQFEAKLSEQIILNSREIRYDIIK